jgi:hypothetical protein
MVLALPSRRCGTLIIPQICNPVLPQGTTELQWRLSLQGPQQAIRRQQYAHLNPRAGGRAVIGSGVTWRRVWMHTEAHRQGVIPNGVRDLSQNDGSRFLFSVLQASWARSFTTFRMTAFKICRFKKTLFAPAVNEKWTSSPLFEWQGSSLALVRGSLLRHCVGDQWVCSTTSGLL